MVGTVERASARERLLDAANELFYQEGVHSVGIDRVIEHAGVAKATLYNAFGSKDELVRAYLTARGEAVRGRLTAGIAKYPTAREKLLGIFDVECAAFARPGYRGCAFVGANAESPRGSAADEVTGEFRGWLRGLLTELATEAGAVDPDLLAKQLMLVYDGANIAAWIDRDKDATRSTREAAAAIVNAACAVSA
jgi:AcrR family transcriptional regulator